MKMKLDKSQTQTRAEFQPATFDAKKRTVDLTWSTGSRVKRYDWNRETYYWEELSMQPGHVRMERLQRGAPLLNNHSDWSLKDVIGVVERAELKDGNGEATVRLSKRDDIAGLVSDIQDGIIRNVSVGYKIHKMERTEEKIENIPVYRVIDWEPLEISFVGIPADMGSQARNEEAHSYECEIINQGANDMGKRNEVKTPAQADVETRSETTPSETQASAPAAQAEQTDKPVESTQAESDKPAEEAKPAQEEVRKEPTAEEVRALEIDRQKVIRSAVRLAGLGEEVGDELANDAKMTVDGARAEIFKKLEAKAPETRNNRIEVKDMDAKQVRQEQATRAILHRFDPDKNEMKQGDTEIGRGSLLDMARNFLHAEGVRDAHLLSRSELAKRALHTSSDFPNVLANVANKTLRAAYEGAPNTYEPFCDSRSVADFKDITSTQLGNGGTLKPVNEEGEYERTSLKDSAEKYKVQKYGLVIGKTWELLMNDDLSAFTRIPQKLGQRAREKENELFWNIILSNPTMAETGAALFSDTHGNRSNSAAISIAELATARQKMRLLKDMDGELSGVTPSYIVVPAALETVAEQYISQIQANLSGSVNPFANKLKLIVEGRLDASSQSAWYVFAEKAKIAMAEIARLEGRGPEMFVKEGFDVDGMELKIRYVFGMKVLDYRGFFRNKT